MLFSAFAMFSGAFCVFIYLFLFFFLFFFLLLLPQSTSLFLLLLLLLLLLNFFLFSFSARNLFASWPYRSALLSSFLVPIAVLFSVPHLALSLWPLLSSFCPPSSSTACVHEANDVSCLTVGKKRKEKSQNKKRMKKLSQASRQLKYTYRN